MFLFYATCWQQNPHESLSILGHAYDWQAMNTEFDFTASTRGKQKQQNENKLYCSLSLNYIIKTEHSYLFHVSIPIELKLQILFAKQKNPQMIRNKYYWKTEVFVQYPPEYFSITINGNIF